MKNYLSLVKFSHTIFAMPFALIGYFLAVHLPSYEFDVFLLLKVVLCMVFARNAAMAFNRYIDRDIDGKNPRTAIREIPAGILSADKVLVFIILNSLAFIATTYFINGLCFTLSPVALIVILGYSVTKRFTALCHIILGLGLALAPIGAYLAVTGVFDIIPVMLGASVLFWVAGFDIIYALQDEDFDKSLGLNSIPVFAGKKKALMISNVLHVITATILVISVYSIHQEYPSTGFLSYGGLLLFLGLLFYQHTLVKANDLSKVGLAFFTTNGIASVLFGLTIILDLYL